MRGKENLGNTEYSYDRITPAYAGKSTGGGLDGTFYKDHPRLCGEKFRLALGDNDFTGSPPPMRGKVIKIADFYGVSRITPAYAGKRCAVPQRYQQTQDHPRLCGEKFFAKAFRVSMVGSPPPMRGKVTYSSEFRAYIRITPAYAGKRLPPVRCDCRLWDHPRLCGEKFRINFFCNAVVGSPPPMRGKGSSPSSCTS